MKHDDSIFPVRHGSVFVSCREGHSRHPLGPFATGTTIHRRFFRFFRFFRLLFALCGAGADSIMPISFHRTTLAGISPRWYFIRPYLTSLARLGVWTRYELAKKA